MLLLSRSDVQKALNMPEAIAAVEEAFIAYAQGEADVPLRTPVSIPAQEATALFMPAFSSRLDALGAKIVTVFPHNTSHNLTTINGLIVLNDTQTGMPLAAMEAGYVTALRTGAASGVATRYLAKADAQNVAIIGAGTQAQTQLKAVCMVRDIQQVSVYDTDNVRSQAYLTHMQEALPQVSFTAAASSVEALAAADIVCTATTSMVPVFPADALKPGTHVNAIGSFTPQMQEIGEDVLHRMDKIVVDCVKAAFDETGDFIIPMAQGRFGKEHIYAELGQLAAGEKLGREDPLELTLFKSVGLAVQDLAVAAVVLEKAQDLNLGRLFDLWK